METRQKEIEEKMKNKVQVTVRCLSDIWNEIGIGKDSRVGRLNSVCEHLTMLCDNMLTEEKGNLAKMKDTIQNCNRELNQLCAALNVPYYQPDQSLSLLQLKENLVTKVMELSKEKDKRLEKMRELCDAEHAMCDRLKTTPKISLIVDSVPTTKQLEDFDVHVKSLQAKVMDRMQTLEQFKEDVRVLLDELDLSPETAFEHDVIKTGDTFVLSDENMQHLHDYYGKLSMLKSRSVSVAESLKEEIGVIWDKLCVNTQHRDIFMMSHCDCHPKTIQSLKEELKRCKLLRTENLQRLTEEARSNLKMLWEQCCFSKEQMEAFQPFYAEDFSEDNLHEIDTEICRLRQLYEQKKDMFDKIKHREQLWLRFLELELNAHQPDRLKNRGGNLLKEEKERSRLLKELPKVEKQIVDEIKELEVTSGQMFLVENRSFEDYVKSQWENHKAQKEAEKLHRQLMKAKQIEEETMFGSKPTISPTKRRFTPSTTNSVIAPKLRRVLSESRHQKLLGSASLAKGPATPSKRNNPGSHLRQPNTSTPSKLPPQTPSRWQTPSKPVFHMLL